MRPLLILLLVSACSAPATGPCALRLAAELPANLDRNRLEVVARVNRTETPMILDTGAERSVLGAATVSSLLLARSQRSATRLSGLTGIGAAVSDADAYANLALGGVHSDGKLAVADLPGIGGLVGADVLSAYDVEFDLPDRKVRLWSARGCGAGDLPWTGPRETIPAEVTDADAIRLPVTVDGAAVPALLDSGASVSLLGEDAARRAGVTQAMLATDGGGPGRGIGQGALGMRLHRFGALQIGAERIDGPRIAVAPLQLKGAQMLLGLDFLRGRRVWVSYGGRQVFVQAAGR